MGDADPDFASSPMAESGPLALAAAGIVAAFGAAACCALPMLLASAGLGTAWLGAVAEVASPIRPILLLVAALSLAGAALFLWRQRCAASACAPRAICARAGVRLVVLLGIVAGLVLLWLGYIYA